MGLFSSSFRTYVGTSISSFGDAKAFVSSKKRGVISGLVRNESLLEHTLDYLITGPGFRAKKAFKYAESDYIFGRPNDTLLYLSASQAAFTMQIGQYLTNVLGAQTVHYTKHGSQNYYHKVFQLLNTDHSFNYVTSELPLLTASKGSLVTLYALRLLVNPAHTEDSSSSYEPISFYPCELIGSTSVASVGAEMTYRWVSSIVSYTTAFTSSGTVLDSSTTTNGYSGGAVNYATSSTSISTTVADAAIVNTNTAATPPATYAATQILKSTVLTTKTTTTTNNTYTVNSPTPVIVLNTTGTISTSAEVDVFSVTLNAGITYSFFLDASVGSNLDPVLTLTNAALTVVAFDDDSGVASNAYFVYTPSASGVFSIRAEGYSTTVGAYSLLVKYFVSSNIGTLVTDVYTLIEEAAVSTITTTTSHQATQSLAAFLETTLEEKASTYSMAAYKNSQGVLTFFTYKNGGNIAALENATATSYSVPGDYLPRLYFRWEGEASNTNKTSTAYLHSKQLAKKMGIAYDAAVEGVNKIDATRSAEDLSQIKSVFLMYGVQADATSQIELAYLYKHFENWHGVVGGPTTTKPLALFNSEYAASDTFEHVLVIEDVRFKITLGMQGVYKRTVTGAPGAVGTYSTDRGRFTFVAGTYVYSNDEGDHTANSYMPVTWFTYRYQNTPNSYIEYHIVGLETKYFVSGNYATASGWTADVNDPKDVLYVPVNYRIVQDMNIFDQEELMYTSMHIVANSLIVQKIKWYQSQFWGLIFKVIAVIAIINGAIDAFSFLEAIVAIASVSLVWAVELVLIALMELAVVVVAAKVFVKVAGEELAFLAAIVASLYGYGNQAFKMGMPLAKEMMAYSNSVFKELTSGYQDKIEDLMGDFDLFQKDSKKQMDALSVIKDSLERPTALGKLYIGESAEDYYAKSHTGNIGTRVYDMQTNYVDLSLRLPRSFNI